MAWSNLKQEINNNKSIDNLYFKEREVWWCACGLNVGFEQDGKGDDFRRPVLIIKKFNQYVSLTVPLTSKDKKGKYYIFCDLGDSLPRKAVISQIKLVDTRRLIDKMGIATDISYQGIKRAIKEYL
ncbi:MAG: type II toxin-antitoxin system PemK/MazF family toxin [Candidatus Magasanikiibacteriota bacterium]